MKIHEENPKKTERDGKKKDFFPFHTFKFTAVSRTELRSLILKISFVPCRSFGPERSSVNENCRSFRKINGNVVNDVHPYVQV